MKRCSFILAMLLAGVARAAEPLPATDEVVGVLKQHYVDREVLDAQKLNDASVTGLLQLLGVGARLMSAADAAANAMPGHVPAAAGERLARAEVIEPDIGYLRLTDVMPETTPALDAELQKFTKAKVTGYILDLRFADGTNYTAAAEVASRFLPAGLELFTWKSSTAESRVFRSGAAPRTLATELADAPLMLLVNGQTSGSAEVLVGALRAQDRGIVVGAPTTGSAAAWQDTVLADGRVLRVATAKVVLANGTTAFPGGLLPDILVKIDPLTERDVVFNLPTNVTLTATLQPKAAKKGFSEADLVRSFRRQAIESPALTLEDDTPAATTSNTLTLASAPSAAVEPVRDIVLQRAVDILKGIRVLLSWR